MFKKLRRRFVIINMSLLTFVFVSIFASIYILTALSGERQLAFTLDRIMNAPPKPFTGETIIATSLLVELNNNNEIIVFSSFINMDEDIIKDVVIKAIETNDELGKVKSGEFSYSFLKKRTPFGTKIAFVDRSLLQENLRSILVIFIKVTGGSLVVLFLISVYLANRAIKPIKEAFERQEEFIADASHELKTPLAIIKANLAVVLENSDETIDSQSKWLDFIHLQTERMSNLINDMLSLAKMDSLEQPLLLQNFNLSNAIEGVVLSFEAASFESNIELETDIQEEVFFYGDKDSFERLMTILMDNAIKNTPQNGRITVSLASRKNNIEIIVKNTGAGITPENMDKIFERFYRVDSSRNRESGGYGLGLAIAKSIVQNHNGKIYAESNLGEDTSFIVKLPKNRS